MLASVRKLFLLSLLFPGALAAVSPLRIGMELAFPPFEFVDYDGVPRGLGVQLAYMLGSRLKRPVELESIPFLGLIPSLNSGRIDLAISSMTITEQRERHLLFSLPYFRCALGMLSRKEALATSEICVVRQGTQGHLWAEKHLPAAQVKLLPDLSSALLELLQGRAGRLVYDAISVDCIAKAYPELLVAGSLSGTEANWGVALKRGEVELLQQMLN